MIIASAETVANKQIAQTLGIAKGNTIRARHVGHDVMAGLQQIVGGELKGYTQMVTEAREEATKRMIEDAENMGADAIVAVRYTSSDVMAGASEILAYGTAVKLK